MSTQHAAVHSDQDDPDVDAARDARVAETLDLAKRFINAIFDDPSLLDDIPEGANVIFLPHDDPDLAERNRAAGLRMRAAGHLVHFAHV